MRSIGRHVTLIGPSQYWLLIFWTTFTYCGPCRAIIGGGPAPGLEYSAIMALVETDQVFCTGTLIAPNWIVTAKHCLEGGSEEYPRELSPQEVRLRIGPNANDHAQRTASLRRWIKAPEGIDIVFGELTESISDIQPIPLSITPLEPSNEAYELGGFGATTVNGAGPLGLRKTARVVLTATSGNAFINLFGGRSEFANYLKHAFPGEEDALSRHLKNGELKAGDKVHVWDPMRRAGERQPLHALADSAYADSGGPLLKKSRGRLEIVGVISTGFPGSTLSCVPLGTIVGIFGESTRQVMRQNGIPFEEGLDQDRAPPLQAQAGWLLQSSEARTEAHGYLAPNEIHPARAVSIFQTAKKGAYIGVGADRCFNLASISPNIDRVLCLDADPEVARFNLMNIFLLRASHNRADYEHLRLRADWREISSRLESLRAKLHPNVVAAVSESDLNSIRAAFDDWRFQALHDRDFPRARGDDGFSKVNYVQKEEQYRMLKRLVDSNRIEAHVANLKQDKFQDYLVDRLQNGLSVIDLSNAWGEHYIGRDKIMRLLNHLAKKNPQALFVYTDQRYKDSDPYDFDYGAVTLANRHLVASHVYAERPLFGILGGGERCEEALLKSHQPPQFQ